MSLNIVMRRGGGYKNLVSSLALSRPSTLLTSKPNLPFNHTINTPPLRTLHTTPKLHTTTTTTMASKQFLSAVEARRTFYALKKESTIPDAQIKEIVEKSLLHVPSSFNSQTTRVMLLVKEEHDALWDIVKEVIKAIVPAEQWSGSEAKLNGFKAAYGTVLFFESRSGVQAMQEKYALYADKFPNWATQADAMLQYVIWTAFQLEGLGCNLQHYNPIIDAKVMAKWNIPEDWVLNAQLVFGTPAAQPGEKTFMELSERFKTAGL